MVSGKGTPLPSQPCFATWPSAPAGTMAWFNDYQGRLQWIVKNGLPVTFSEARCDPTGFVALYCHVDDNLLPRSNECRGFELHVTLGFWSQFKQHMTYEQLDVLLGEINARWAGAHHVLWAEWTGRGASAQTHPEHPVCLDTVITALHDIGGHQDRQLHVSL